MAAKGLVVYLLTCFSLAVLSVYFVNNYAHGGYAQPGLLSSSNSNALQRNYGSEAKVWPVSLWLLLLFIHFCICLRFIFLLIDCFKMGFLLTPFGFLFLGCGRN